jgi:cysteinyl-tRNA synthetase
MRLQLADKNVWRLLFLMTHPRSPLDYSSERLKQAETSWARLENALLSIDASNGDASTRNGTSADAAQVFQQKFDAALLDDMNTPEALAAIFDAVTEYNRSGDESLARSARAHWRRSASLLKSAVWAMRSRRSCSTCW